MKWMFFNIGLDVTVIFKCIYSNQMCIFRCEYWNKLLTTYKSKSVKKKMCFGMCVFKWKIVFVMKFIQKIMYANIKH